MIVHHGSFSEKKLRSSFFFPDPAGPTGDNLFFFVYYPRYTSVAEVGSPPNEPTAQQLSSFLGTVSVLSEWSAYCYDRIRQHMSAYVDFVLNMFLCLMLGRRCGPVVLVSVPASIAFLCSLLLQVSPNCCLRSFEVTADCGEKVGLYRTDRPLLVLLFLF